MELILSSPFPIAALVVGLIVAGVFVYELRLQKQKAQATPPLPPTSIPIVNEDPSLKKRQIAIISGIVVVALLLIGGTYVLTRRTPPAPEVEPTPPVAEVEPTAFPTEIPVVPTDVIIPTNVPRTSTAPICQEFISKSSSGRAPLSVSFEASAMDNTSIKAFDFIFGDGATQKIEKDYGTGIARQTIDHVYTLPGTYTASVIVTDSDDTNNNISDCTLSIQVLTETGEAAPAPIGGASNPSPTIAAITSAPTITRAPSRTPTPTIVGQKVATGSATPTTVLPEIPEAGNGFPTALVSLGGLALVIISVALLL